jgi:hypothetical protein
MGKDELRWSRGRAERVEEWEGESESIVQYL